MSFLNSVHVEELLEVDATRLLHDEGLDEMDWFHEIAWTSFVEFSASMRTSEALCLYGRS